VSSDELRKRLLGIALSAHAPATTYTPAARAEIYRAVVDAVRLVLAQGRGVVVDATYLRESDRQPLAAVARCYGAPLLFLECTTTDDIVHRRLADRPPGPSDATFEVFRQQAQEQDLFGPDEVHQGLDTSGDLATNGARALEAVWHWRRQGPHDLRADYTPYRTISGCAAK
jgi:predicted kinase